MAPAVPKPVSLTHKVQVLGFGFTEYPFIHEKPGWSEHEPMGYWHVACQLISEALASGTY
jgi:sugar (pentulose or hexulose) kinase